MEATKSEDAPHDSHFEPMDEERRRFLEEALKSLTLDVVEEIEKAMKTLMDPDKAEEDKADAIEIIIDFVQDIDAANGRDTLRIYHSKFSRLGTIGKSSLYIIHIGSTAR